MRAILGAVPRDGTPGENSVWVMALNVEQYQTCDRLAFGKLCRRLE